MKIFIILLLIAMSVWSGKVPASKYQQPITYEQDSLKVYLLATKTTDVLIDLLIKQKIKTEIENKLLRAENSRLRLNIIHDTIYKKRRLFNF